MKEHSHNLASLDGLVALEVDSLVLIVLTPWINIHHLLCCSPKLQVDEQEDDAHEEADAADDNVGDAQEGVLPANDARGGDDHALGSLELRHLEVVANFQPVGVVMPQALTFTEGSIFAIHHFPVELSEVG